MSKFFAVHFLLSLDHSINFGQLFDFLIGSLTDVSLFSLVVRVLLNSLIILCSKNALKWIEGNVKLTYEIQRRPNFLNYEKIKCSIFINWFFVVAV